MLDVDVAVIGGGLVGASLATAVATHPLSKSLSVAVIDPKPPDISTYPPLEPRTSTVTPSSKQFLDDIGAWSHIPANRIASFDKMFIWDHPRSLPLESHDFGNSAAGTLVFDSKDIDEEFLGFVVDNATLRNALFRRMHELSSTTGLKVIASSVEGITFAEGTDAGGDDSPEFPVVSLSDGTSIRARLIAACDGARSRVRTLAGADWFSKPYDQSAVVANVLLKDFSSVAYQRFVSTGPVAVLPLSTDETSAPVGNIVWTTTPMEARGLVECDDAQFLDELNTVLTGDEDDDADDAAGSAAARAGGGDALWGGLARGLQLLPGYAPPAHRLAPPQATRLHSRRHRFPLALGHAPRYVLPDRRTVLVGDAAHAVHPLAGQGVNMGFGDAEALAGSLARAAGTGRDFGGERGACLARFEGERMLANVAAIGVLHGLVGAFGVGNQGMAGLRGLRRVGLSGVNAVRGVRQGIMKAMR